MSGWRERQAKKVEAEKTAHLELNEINFPSLSANSWNDHSATLNTKKLTKSFASLAREWNDHAEQEKLREDIEREKKIIEDHEREQIRKRRSTMYNFGNAHAREEDTYYEMAEDDYLPQSSDKMTDDWRTISKKIRKVRAPVFECPIEPPIQEEETAWGQTDPYE